MLFPLGFLCVFVASAGGVLQRDLLESDVQNDIANDDKPCNFNLGIAIWADA